MRYAAAGLIVALVLSACTPAPEPEAEPEPSSAAPIVEAPPRLSDKEAGAAFLNALKSGDEALKAYGWRDDATSAAKAHMQKLRDIALTNTLVAVEYARGGPIAMVIFYRPEDEAQLYDAQWRRDSYLKTLFVCNFEDTSTRWKFTDPLYCYSEDPSPFAE